jgi:hypothetical protein
MGGVGFTKKLRYDLALVSCRSERSAEVCEPGPTTSSGRLSPRSAATRRSTCLSPGGVTHAPLRLPSTVNLSPTI